MVWVYILKSEKNNRFYIGSTKDLKRRLREHKRGETKSLKNILPVRLVFKQSFNSLKTARGIETKLKRLKRKDCLEKIIKGGYTVLGT